MVVSDTTTMQRANKISVSLLGLLQYLGTTKVGIISDITKYFCFYLAFYFRSPTQREPTHHLEPSCSTIWEPEQRANSLSILFYFRNIMQPANTTNTPSGSLPDVQSGCTLQLSIMPDGCRHHQTDAGSQHHIWSHHAALCQSKADAAHTDTANIMQPDGCRHRQTITARSGASTK